MNTFLFNAIMAILLATKLGQSFPIFNQKLPSTYDEKECPPGFLPCVSENEDKVSNQVGGATSSVFATNATNPSLVKVPTPTALPSKATGHRKTPNGGIMEETGDSGTKSLHGNHECPPGVWVC